jgi:hypothetical protein
MLQLDPRFAMDRTEREFPIRTPPTLQAEDERMKLRIDNAEPKTHWPMVEQRPDDPVSTLERILNDDPSSSHCITLVHTTERAPQRPKRLKPEPERIACLQERELPMLVKDKQDALPPNFVCCRTLKLDPPKMKLQTDTFFPVLRFPTTSMLVIDLAKLRTESELPHVNSCSTERGAPNLPFVAPLTLSALPSEK